MNFCSLALIILLPLQSLALDCKQSVSLLNEGEKAPCTGYLFSPDAEKKASQAVDDVVYYKELADLYKKRSDLTNEELKVMDERLNLYIKSTNDLAKEVIRKDSEDFWKKTFYFTLGVVTTGLIYYGAAKTQK